jgi:Mrp family chromosome partitioning ATPase
MNNLESYFSVTAHTQLSEEFRIIKRRMLEGTPPGQAKARAILVTSTLAGEGKSFIARNLAISLTAGGEVPVILVDAGWNRRGLSDRLDMGLAPGLAELLSDDVLSLESVLQPTGVAALSLLPAGQSPRTGGEALLGRRLTRRIDELLQYGGGRSMTVIDAPPVLASTEGILWAGHVGMAVVVVQGRRTPRRLLHRTLSLVQACPDVRCVLNMVDTDAYGQQGYG